MGTSSVAYLVNTQSWGEWVSLAINRLRDAQQRTGLPYMVISRHINPG